MDASGGKAMKVAVEFTGTATLSADRSPVPGSGSAAFAKAVADIAGDAIECRAIQSVTVCTPSVDGKSGTTTWSMTTTAADGSPLAQRRAAIEEIRTNGGLRHKLSLSEDAGTARQIGIFERLEDAQAIVEAWKDGLIGLTGIIPTLLRTA